MKITKSYLKSQFKYLNQKCFFNSLPMPKIKIKNMYKNVGLFSWNYDEYGNTYGYTITISGIYDYEPYQIESVMAHEMIHYYLMYNKIDMSGGHDFSFLDMANTIMARHNIYVTEIINTSNYKIRKRRFKFFYDLYFTFH